MHVENAGSSLVTLKIKRQCSGAGCSIVCSWSCGQLPKAETLIGLRHCFLSKPVIIKLLDIGGGTIIGINSEWSAWQNGFGRVVGIL